MWTFCSFAFVLALVAIVEAQWWLPSGLFGRLFENCLSPPMECPNENIKFFLYTRETQDSPHLLDVNDPSSFKSAGFVKGKPLKILIHGYTGHRDFSPNTEIRPAYLQNGEYNVISVDYGPLAQEPCYIQAAYNTPLVGKCTAQLLDKLIDDGVVPLSDVHVIGFSLGAQVAGQVGQYLKSGKLPRLTGLDPAMPLFATPWKSNKLDSTDAVFVDVIHTNAGSKGKIDASGDVDFYTNGGFQQPGCDAPGIPSSDSCAHARAPEYFAESISSDEGFWGTPCDSWTQYLLNLCNNSGPKIEMGEHVPLNATGSYFLFTNIQPPYARGTAGAFNISIN
ncbi:inactive pancreatic lipase-related protein 1-like [Schistocerca cancellata]|uniref:inactive pancreatic lipase-related protein 1-like n=1 Tax=Schistocerca cancellata TaxID=274614 RepID=UPI002118D1BD|nr:inactive pancreatic lipase-related protein 1-like [Schistocerca cancellata]